MVFLSNYFVKKQIMSIKCMFLKKCIIKYLYELNKIELNINKCTYTTMDALFKTFVTSRIVVTDNIDRVTISTINDEFKCWYRSIHGNTQGCNHAIKDLKPFLETRFGKYPPKGWFVIKLSEEEYDTPSDNEELITIQKINICMGEVNTLIHKLVSLKTIDYEVNISMLRAEIIESRQKMQQMQNESQKQIDMSANHKKYFKLKTKEEVEMYEKNEINEI